MEAYRSSVELKNRTCDKCRKPVTSRLNSVQELEYRLQSQYDPAVAFMLDMTVKYDRHLFPTDSCPGSPSRAQYLGGAEDPRYPKSDSFRPRILKAWEDLHKDLGLEMTTAVAKMAPRVLAWTTTEMGNEVADVMEDEVESISLSYRGPRTIPVNYFEVAVMFQVGGLDAPEQGETAIVWTDKKADHTSYFILDGDWRERYSKAYEENGWRGISKLYEFFRDRFGSKWSSDGGRIR